MPYEFCNPAPRAKCQELKTMNDMRTPPELGQVIDAVVNTKSIQEFDLADEFFPAHLSVAVIDAVFRTRYRHGAFLFPAAERYCRKFGLVRTRHDRWNRPAANEQDTLGDLIRRYDDLGLDAMTADVFAIRRCFPEQQIPPVATVLRVAKALRSIGVDLLQDMSARHYNKIHDTLLCLPGVGAHTVRRLLMYTGGDDFVLGDTHIRRFVADAVGRNSISPDDAVALIRSAAYELLVSPRFLDREIWLCRLSD